MNLPEHVGRAIAYILIGMGLIVVACVVAIIAYGTWQVLT